MMSQAQVSKSIANTSGGLFAALTSTERSTITNLTITGTVDYQDFVTMNNMRLLSTIDLSGASIVAYTYGSTVYPANTIPSQAFSNKTSLTTLTLPVSVSAIGSYAFSSCGNLKLFTIPASVTSIGDGSFTGCGSLTTTTVPASVTSIGAEAFSTCNHLTGPITIPFGVTAIGNATFKQCSALTSVIIPSTVTSIGDNAFYRCDAITSMDIPSSVKTIGASAFSSSYRLASVTIPASVTSIGNQTFYGCIGLTSIYAYPVTPVDLVSIYTAVFTSVNTNTCTLYVPVGSKTAYQTAVQWRDFQKIVEITTPVPELNSTTIKVYTQKSSIIVEGTSVGEKISVYNLNGVMLQTIQSKGERFSIPVEPNVVYLVKTPTKIIKIKL